HACGSEAAWFWRTGRARQQEVAVQGSLPRQARRAEPFEDQRGSVLESLHSGARIRMTGLLGNQPRDLAGRILDRVRRAGRPVADDVDGGKEKVEGGEAGPDEHHLAPRLLRRSGRGQRGQAGADHGDVGLHRWPATSAAVRPPPWPSPASGGGRSSRWGGRLPPGAGSSISCRSRLK